jgi:hypothetical protein
MATLAVLKQKLSIPSLDLVRGKDKDTNQPNGWLRHWDDDRRIAVVVHEDVVKAIKANPSIDTLALKHETKKTTTGKAIGTIYDQYILISATSIEVSL